MTWNQKVGTVALAALVATVGIVAGRAAAGPGERRCHDRHGERAAVEERIQELGLEPDASDAVLALLAERREQGRALRGEMHLAHQVLESLLEAPELDLPVAEAQVAVVANLKAEAHRARVGMMLELRQLVSHEEWQALHEAIRPHRRHHRFHHGKGSRHGEPPELDS
jgi:Spy/CpxP family protein refolding chaperone